MKLLYDFSKINEWDSVKILDIVNNYIFKYLNNSNIVVKISNCDEVGCINKSEIHIFQTYTDALRLINENEYKSLVAVEVYEWINESLQVYSSSIISKCFDGVCYRRFAQVHSIPVELSTWREAFDTNALVYLRY